MTMPLTHTSDPADNATARRLPDPSPNSPGRENQPPSLRETPGLSALWTLVEIALLLLTFLGLSRLFERVWEGLLAPVVTSQLGF